MIPNLEIEKETFHDMNKSILCIFNFACGIKVGKLGCVLICTETFSSGVN